MDRSEVIELLSSTYTRDAYGVEREQITSRRVFCQVDSVTASEFFEGGRNGLNPEYRFSVFFGDYQGEEMVRYNGLTYGIYRTYHARKDVLELYAERKGGTNGKENTD